MDPRVRQFYDRMLKATDYTEKVLCINNAFFVYYKNEFSKKAAEVCGMTEKDFLDAVEYCREDSDSRRILFTQAQLDKLTKHLAEIFK